MPNYSIVYSYNTTAETVIYAKNEEEARKLFLAGYFEEINTFSDNNKLESIQEA